jgi:hypothetical protein
MFVFWSWLATPRRDRVQKAHSSLCMGHGLSSQPPESIKSISSCLSPKSYYLLKLPE